MREYDVSVLIVTYNPVWEKLKNTVLSVIRQKNINVEIIIADDGSATNYREELKRLFLKENYSDYVLVMNDINKGTVLNIKSGLQVTHGKYVKTLSPGDYLYSLNTLELWYTFMEAKNISFSFGNPIYYSREKTGEYLYHKVRRNPQNIDIYNVNNYRKKQAVLYYVFLNDATLGSTYLIKRELLEKYIDSICNQIKYAEDMMVNLMVADGEKIVFYNQNVVWYENGTGISTSNDRYWYDILDRERLTAYQMVCNSFKRQKSYYLYFCTKLLLKQSTKMYKYIFLPNLIFCKLNKDKIKAYTNDSPEVTIEIFLEGLE